MELYGHTCRAFRNAPPTLRDLYEQSRSDLPFIVYDDERLSFEAAWREASRIATLLVTEYGIEKGDRVAISMRNIPEWMLAFSAVTSIGGIAVAPLGTPPRRFAGHAAREAKRPARRPRGPAGRRSWRAA